MAFPRRFQHLIETELDDVEAPDYVWLVYAVCAISPDACGWGGWMIEAAFRRTGESHPTGTGDKLVGAQDEQVCPRCGKETYRTGATLRFERSADQSPPRRAGIDYEVVQPTYED
jgi:hypothetical protein